jgi:sarcosine oxidase subunit alpha
MPSQFTVRVNRDLVTVPAGSTVALAIMIAGQPCRISVTGEPRGPLCGMGICFECRAVVNGIPHSRTCQILCEPNMEVSTDE